MGPTQGDGRGDERYSLPSNSWHLLLMWLGLEINSDPIGMESRVACNTSNCSAFGTRVQAHSGVPGNGMKFLCYNVNTGNTSTILTSWPDKR